MTDSRTLLHAARAKLRAARAGKFDTLASLGGDKLPEQGGAYTPEQNAALDAELLDCNTYEFRGIKIMQTPEEHERMKGQTK